jgi:hypothetical protein
VPRGSGEPDTLDDAVRVTDVCDVRGQRGQVRIRVDVDELAELLQALVKCASG